MKKITMMLIFSLVSSVSMSREGPAPFPLDKIVFRVAAKQWVSTETALLTVNVNATLNNADLVQARADIMNRLTKIATGEWHLTQFSRSQDSSGLEKLFVEAQARIPQASLTDIYQNAKNVSKPGATYTVTSVEFKPSLQEIEKVKTQLRTSLYQQVNDELSRLNKVYTTQNYTVNRLYVFEGDAVPLPQAYEERKMTVMAMASAPAPNLSVSNELTMSAMVEAGSNRQRSKDLASN